MSGNNFLVDTNILIYLLEGNERLEQILTNKNLYVSFISELELLTGRKNTSAEMRIERQLLANCKIVDLNKEIKEKVIEFRRKHNLKLPDSIVLATADYLNIPLLTADTDFRNISGSNIYIFEKA